MSPDDATSQYRRLMGANAETVMLSRLNIAGTFGPIAARVMGFMADDVVLDVQQGNRKLIMLADDVSASGFPVPLRKTDTVIWNGKTLRITDVDEATRRVQGVLIAYELVVAGA